MKLVTVLLVLLTAPAVSGFVYSCNEVIYTLLNAGPQAPADRACIFLDEDFEPTSAMDNIILQNNMIGLSLAVLISLPDKCIDSPPNGGPWRITNNGPVDLVDCDSEFTLVLTSSKGKFIQTTNETVDGSSSAELVFVSPRGGMFIGLEGCTGTGNVNFYSGAGTGENENRFHLKSWSCADLPRYVATFDNVITVIADPGITYEYDLEHYESGKANTNQLIMQYGQNVAILSSGQSDNLMNLNKPANYASFLFRNPENLTVSGFVSLDSTQYHSYLVLIVYNDEGTVVVNFKDDNVIGEYYTNVWKIEVNYESDAVTPQTVGTRNENFAVELFVGQFVPLPTAPPARSTTIAPVPSTSGAPKTTGSSQVKTTTATASSGSGQYCGCNMGGKFNLPIDWDPTEIWLDIAIILDTSEAMGEDSLGAASAMIESFVGDGVLVTDLSADFSARVGVISMAKDAEVLYDLNMTSADRIEGKAHISKGLDEIDVVKAFDAALDMFNRGVKSRPERANYRQVIYYVTDSDPKVNLNPLNQFKTSNGIIIVNNFLEEGDAERPGLEELASDGFYFKDIREDYMLSVQAFCKANCFCPGDRDAYAGKNPDPALKAAGGCYHPVSAGVGFSKAKQTCSDLRGGLVASVHDDKKAAFLNDLVFKVYKKKYYFWIGYTRDDSGNWVWEDKLTDSYTNWDVDEPSSASISKCAFADMTEDNLPWGAGNCNIGMPYVCEYVPCSAGNKIC